MKVPADVCSQGDLPLAMQLSYGNRGICVRIHSAHTQSMFCDKMVKNRGDCTGNGG